MRRIEKIINIMAMFILPFFIFFLFENMIRNPFEKMKTPIILLNVLFFELLFFGLLSVFGSVKAAIRVEAILSFLIGLTNYFILSFRSAPIMPWDIYSIGTALSVADNYEYTLSKEAAISSILLLLIAVCCQWLRMRISRKWTVRAILTAVSVLSLWGYIRYIQRDATVTEYKIYDKLFTPTTMTYRDGTAVAFIMEMKYLRIDKPDGYRASKAEDLLASYRETSLEPARPSRQNPNIIVIMDEAFSDLSVLGEYETNVDEIPYMRTLMENGENTISGYLDVSVLGGNTANTEFEFLTGDTMAFLPQGSIPYQQYIKKPLSSMASHLKEYGYLTYAMHPYRAKGWDRDKVYSYFGFDRFYSQADFDNPQLLRKYISDQSNMDKIKEIFETKQDGVPLFLFNVTMQNHSSYTEEYDNFTPDVMLNGSDSIALNQYLSLLKKSDEALYDIISYFDAQSEPVIVLFFGDHQPTNSVVSPIYKQNKKSVLSLSDEELQNRYKVPFIIHANFDIQEEYGLSLSANYLGVKTLETAGIPLNAYQSFLSVLSKQYPSVTSIHITDQEGVYGLTKERKDQLAEYQILQYYHLFQ